MDMDPIQAVKKRKKQELSNVFYPPFLPPPLSLKRLPWNIGQLLDGPRKQKRPGVL